MKEGAISDFKRIIVKETKHFLWLCSVWLRQRGERDLWEQLEYLSQKKSNLSIKSPSVPVLRNKLRALRECPQREKETWYGPTNRQLFIGTPWAPELSIVSNDDIGVKIPAAAYHVHLPPNINTKYSQITNSHLVCCVGFMCWRILYWQSRHLVLWKKINWLCGFSWNWKRKWEH